MTFKHRVWGSQDYCSLGFSDIYSGICLYIYQIIRRDNPEEANLKKKVQVFITCREKHCDIRRIKQIRELHIQKILDVHRSHNTSIRTREFCRV
jgi:hypothetical protein